MLFFVWFVSVEVVFGGFGKFFCFGVFFIIISFWLEIEFGFGLVFVENGKVGV